MPTNIEAIKSARSLKYKAINIISYVQRPPGFCATLVAWWIRRKLQGKNTWDHKYFNQPTLNNNNLTDTDRGITKQNSMQPIIGIDSQAMGNYILSGQRPDNPSKDLRRSIGDKVAVINFQNVSVGSSNDLVNLMDTFKQISERKAVAEISFRTGGANHALALDCLTDAVQVSYFDPNFGELTFPDKQRFTEWWTECYRKRTYGVGSFGMLEEIYKAVLYSKEFDDINNLLGNMDDLLDNV